MPVTKSLPLKWFETENIHPGTIKDLRNLFRSIFSKTIRNSVLSMSIRRSDSTA